MMEDNKDNKDNKDSKDSKDSKDNNDGKGGNSTLMQRFEKTAMLMHRYQHLGWRERGPFANPHRGQGRILAVLKMQPEISQRDLAYLLDMRNQSLSELLAKMEKAGYITRNQSEADRRVVDIKLTDAGKEAAERAAQQKEGDGDVFSVLGEDEQKIFGDYLSRIDAELEKRTGDEPDMMEALASEYGMTPEMIEAMKSRELTPEMMDFLRDRGFPPEMVDGLRGRGFPPRGPGHFRGRPHPPEGPGRFGERGFPPEGPRHFREHDFPRDEDERFQGHGFQDQVVTEGQDAAAPEAVETQAVKGEKAE